jgi:hypothetical protein
MYPKGNILRRRGQHIIDVVPGAGSVALPYRHKARGADRTFAQAAQIPAPPLGRSAGQRLGAVLTEAGAVDAKAVRSGTPASGAEAVWNSAILQASEAAACHPLDRRFSSPDRWPSYYLVRQRSLALASQASPAAPKPAVKAGLGPQAPERFFEARGGRLVGRPDYYDGSTITEYKSALPDLAWVGAAAIIESFRRQLRLYAAIIAEATGRWPAAARIITASGQKLDVDVNADACTVEAEAAVAALPRDRLPYQRGKDQSVRFALRGSCPGPPYFGNPFTAL